jgi:hypothetical protein
MDYEDFFSITEEQLVRIQQDGIKGIKKYETERPMQRQELNNLKLIYTVGGIDETIYYRGYVDKYDIWESDGNLYLRHRVHDSTD